MADEPTTRALSSAADDTPRPAAGDQGRILVVDDELGVRESLRTILRPHYEVATAESGEAALQIIPTFHPDLVFIDIKMPAMDGFEVLRRIKAYELMIEVVMITAYASVESLRQSLTEGAFEYLIKPFSRQDVEEAARRALARRACARGAHGRLGRLAEEMRSLAGKAQALEEAAQREALAQSLRVTQLSILREISQGILGQLDLTQLIQGITDSLKAGLGYDDVSIVLGAEAASPTDCPTRVVYPVRDGPSMLGILVVDTCRSERVIDPSEHELLEMLADQVAIAVRNSQLHAKTQQWLRHTRTLLAVSQAAGSTLELTEVVRRTIREMVRVLGADLGGALLLNPTRDHLIPLAGYRLPKELVASYTRTPLRFEYPLAEADKRLEESIFSSDSQADPRLAHPLAQLVRHQSVLVVPMRLKGQVIGGIAIVWVRAAHHFTEEERQLVEGIAQQAAIAIENSRLVAELRQALEEIETSQHRIIETERLRALGEMAGGVAHDFNNTLAAILGRAQLLLTQVGDPAVRRQLEVIKKAAEDGARTVRRIQEFTRRRRARAFGVLDLNQVVEEVMDLTRSRWNDEAQAKGLLYEVIANTQPILPVLGDASELREALTNLIFNALDAMPKGGRITITTEVKGDRVTCVVTDTGIGMTEDVRQRVFDPFFTTKGEKGSGLGLSVVYGIITRHGGDIQVQSQVGQGSAFTIYLPVAHEVPEAMPPAPRPEPSRLGQILIIDDDEEVREALGDLLASQGHTVVTCADGQTGLTRLQETPFDLVITDLAMPGLTGWQVARLVKLRNPATPVALLTGFSDQIDPDEARTKGATFLLPKPFTLEDVTAVLAQALSHEDPRPSAGRV